MLSAEGVTNANSIQSLPSIGPKCQGKSCVSQTIPSFQDYALNSQPAYICWLKLQFIIAKKKILNLLLILTINSLQIDIIINIISITDSFQQYKKYCWNIMVSDTSCSNLPQKLYMGEFWLFEGTCKVPRMLWGLLFLLPQSLHLQLFPWCLYSLFLKEKGWRKFSINNVRELRWDIKLGQSHWWQ